MLKSLEDFCLLLWETDENPNSKMELGMWVAEVWAGANAGAHYLSQVKWEGQKDGKWGGPQEHMLRPMWAPLLRDWRCP